MNRVNDFAFKIATANGTGSASANGLIMQAIFRMGVPVTGKNVFPSNIQGLPTWYEIRVNKHGYSARTPEFDLMVALNAATYQKDVAEVRAGGWLLYDSTWPLDDKLRRPDVTYLGVPLAEMCNAAFKGVRERILMKNIAYAGALAALLEMDTDVLRELLQEKFGRKPALMDSNQKAVDLGYDYAKANFACPLPIHLERMDATKDSILIDGNTAAGLGCVYAGATVGAWYPITPATSLMEAFRGFCQKYRVDPETKKNRFAVVQAEDELAAVGVVIGAGVGRRAGVHADRGPRHLADERVHRPGLLHGDPGGHLRRAAHRALHRHAHAHAAGRPDDVRLRVARRHAAHLPVSRRPEGSVRDGGRVVRPGRALPDAGLRAERPGHRHERLDCAEAEVGRRVSSRSRQGAVGRGAGKGQDVLPLPGRGRRRHPVPHRCLACTRRAPTSPAARATTSTAATPRTTSNTREVLDRIDRKIQRAAKAVPQPFVRKAAGAKMGLITVGGCHAACIEALDILAKDGVPIDFMRVRGFPFGEDVAAFVDSHDVTFVVEQNRDAQLRSLIVLETGVHMAKLESVRYYGGFPMSAHHVITGVKAKLEKAA